MISAKIICDSVSRTNDRITSFILVYPRMIHSELLTHRMFSRNAASSRAIPISKMVNEVLSTPARPVFWGKNQSGMQAAEELEPEIAAKAIEIWDAAAKSACDYALKLYELGVHKQIANRVIEPWAHMTTLVTATEFHNFFGLRAHKDAQPEFQCLAYKMLKAYLESFPEVKQVGEWHIPFGDQMAEGLSLDQRLAIATARSARLSYKTFDGVIDPQKDYDLHDNLKKSGHWSPFEHCAEAVGHHRPFGNFTGWFPYRKRFLTENKTNVDLQDLLNNKVTFSYDDNN